MTSIPLDLWAYQVHRALRAPVLERLGHPPAAPLPAALVDPRLPPPAAALAAHREALNASAAAVADYLREAGPRGRHLVSLYAGRGAAPDLGSPLVDPGPGLADLAAVVAHLATRKIGAPPVPAPPKIPGYTVKAHPVPCPVCGARTWSATPSRPAIQVRPDATTITVDDPGTPHRCPA